MKLTYIYKSEIYIFDTRLQSQENTPSWHWLRLCELSFWYSFLVQVINAESTSVVEYANDPSNRPNIQHQPPTNFLRLADTFSGTPIRSIANSIYSPPNTTLVDSTYSSPISTAASSTHSPPTAAAANATSSHPNKFTPSSILTGSKSCTTTTRPSTTAGQRNFSFGRRKVQKSCVKCSTTKNHDSDPTTCPGRQYIKIVRLLQEIWVSQCRSTQDFRPVSKKKKILFGPGMIWPPFFFRPTNWMAV
jgi:hypothetical protein